MLDGEALRIIIAWSDLPIDSQDKIYTLEWLAIVLQADLLSLVQMLPLTQLNFKLICSKSTIKTLEKSMKYFKS